MTAQVCREVGTRPGTTVAHPTPCAPILRLAVAPGVSEVADALPANLRSDPVILLTYRVQILNSVERSAGDSAAAFAAAGTAPPPLESLQAKVGERGTFLTWNTDSATADLAQQVEFARTDLSVQSAVESPAKPNAPASRPRLPRQGKEAAATHPSSAPGAVRLRTPQYAATVAQESATQRAEATDGLLDTTAIFGVTYSYSGQRIRSVAVGPRSLEIRSEPSPMVNITLRDTFPPARPTGLTTIPASGNGPSYIDLSWEPNTEPDLVGYIVYRQAVSASGGLQAPAVKLTRSPIAAPAYRDMAAVPGQRYSYWVTAVDASGNESAPSAQAREMASPEAVQSPH